MMLLRLRAQASTEHQKVQLTQVLPDTCQTVAGEDNTIHCCMSQGEETSEGNVLGNMT